MGQTKAIVGLNDRENHGTGCRAQYTLGPKGDNSGVERRFSRIRLRTCFVSTSPNYPRHNLWKDLQVNSQHALNS